ncbi:alpha/beta hydrolase fold domain-containing protein [Sphingobium sp. CR2-8]|uniref:alpha/beta hydrolase n=1 Tax=Sphingobium sp. CR2-8 TaxID=1306534 RepID=UPI002DB940F9|nr:alpha/beta hydrolase fold domain-containing protein [Sphingobium sp. CR2-8]MEC3910126.1 alpha/beta hydrolase fold domain-containing protein [Sphingobium sp. CR2-8]
MTRVAIMATLIACGSIGDANAQTQSVAADSNGVITAHGVKVPPSDLLSAPARSQIEQKLARATPSATSAPSLSATRALSDAFLQSVVDKWQRLHPATIRSLTMNGVKVDEIIPTQGIAPENAHRVLINLHGGGFFTGSGAGGQAEALPLAGQGRIKVIAIDYRLAPEHRFPAASQDVAQVYRKLLENYKPENIGLYGCSAGGALVAQSLAWFQKHALPRLGAAGIFCAGAMPTFWYGGDSSAVAPMLNGRIAPTPEQRDASPGHAYLAGTDPHDPLVTPGLFPDVLAQFPPTLLVTGTRDTAMSNVLVTNVALLKAGVDTQLLVLEGTGHGEFNTMVDTPETADAYAIIWQFFDRHLGR